MDDGLHSIDDALALLRQGKELEKEQKFWEATDMFLQGRQVLQSLAIKQIIVAEDDKKIVSLYEEKAQEYLRHSRKTLLEAMTLEIGPSAKREDFYENLTDEEAEFRIRIFYSLFAKKVETREAEKDLVAKQWSIEERLQELNASLPSGFKTDQERMDSVNQGLNRLGLSLYTQKRPFERFQDALPKSEEDQIEEIMAQAKDEVAFEHKLESGLVATTTLTHVDNDFDDDDDDDEDNDESDSDKESREDIQLDDDQLAIKRIRKRVVQVQTKLAELVALLDEAKAARDDKVKMIETPDVDSDSDIEKPSVEMYLSSGKKKLESSRRHLNKAKKEWNDACL